MKDRWDEMSEVEKENFTSAGQRACRQAVDTGSKLENHLIQFFKDKGYGVLRHQNNVLYAKKLETDIILPAQNIVIEIDGPSHYKPIRGMESLRRTQAADAKKDGLLHMMGYNVIRVIQTRNVSTWYLNSMAELTLEVVKELTGKKKQSRKVILPEDI